MATCGEVLVELLGLYGIDTVFGIPGVHTLDLYRGLADIDETTIKHHDCKSLQNTFLFHVISFRL